MLLIECNLEWKGRGTGSKQREFETQTENYEPPSSSVINLSDQTQALNKKEPQLSSQHPMLIKYLSPQ